MKEPKRLVLPAMRSDTEPDPIAAEVGELKRRALAVVRLELDALERLQAKAHGAGKSLTRAQASTLRVLLTTLSGIGASERRPWRRGGPSQWPGHPKEGS